MGLLVPEMISPKLENCVISGSKNERNEQLINHDIKLYNADYTIPSL